MVYHNIYIYIPESSNKGAIFMDDKGKPQISTIGFRALEGRGRCRTWESSKLQFLPLYQPSRSPSPVAETPTMEPLMLVE